MKNRKWIGVLCLVLALTLTAGAVLSAAGAGFVSDVDGDGKITAFDAQMIAESNAGKRQLSETQLSAIKGISVQNIIKFLRGESVIDAGDTDGDGVQEIYTALGLEQLREQPDADFILAMDLDLEGADWEPVANFSGSFDGNGNTISNFTITASVPDTNKNTVDNMGFFGDTAMGAQIKNLNLQNVTLTAAEDAEYIGFFAGTLRGTLTDCTVTGTICDSRETYTEEVYIGVMAGRVASGSGGSITGGTALSITDEVGKYTTTGLCANVKLDIANSEDLNIKGCKGKVALAGYHPADSAVTGKFVDTSNSSDQLSQVLQDRQNKVVSYMNAMGTVKWTPTETLYYTSNNGTDQTYKAGTVYTGLPYNGHNGSYERFLSVMDYQNDSGVYVASSELESGGFVTSSSTTNYVRMYHLVDEDTGAVTAKLSKTSIVPAEVITFDSANHTLCYSAEGRTFYLGATADLQNLHMTGTSVSSMPAHLYTINSRGKASLVKEPQTGTAYKLGFKAADGSVLFFNGESNGVGTPFLYTTSELGDAQDVYLKSVDGGYQLYFELAGAWTDYGFYLTMGNDCSGAVTWAWLQVSNTLAEDTLSHSIPYKGGVYVQTTQYMIPTETTREHKGIYPVGDWDATATNEEGKLVTAPYDSSKAAYECTDEVYTPAVLNANGLDTMYEAYAQSRKADALVCFVDYWNSGVPRPAGHSRLIVADPIVIRNADGTIDPKASYLLETEQGAGFNSSTTWSVNRKYTFHELTGGATETPVSMRTKTYIPITMRALREEYVRSPYLVEVKNATDPSKNFPINSPTEGRMYSYSHIHTVTVTVKNGSGSVLYQHEAFTGIGTDYATYRGRNNDLYMEDLFGEDFNARAADCGLRNGRTYYFSVDVLLSTGETITLVQNRSFKYAAQ